MDATTPHPLLGSSRSAAAGLSAASGPHRGPPTGHDRLFARSSATTEPARSSGHGRSLIARRAPVPFGVTTNLSQNFPNRAAQSDLGAHGSGDGSTAAFGPAFMASSQHEIQAAGRQR